MGIRLTSQWSPTLDRSSFRCRSSRRRQARLIVALGVGFASKPMLEAVAGIFPELYDPLWAKPARNLRKPIFMIEKRSLRSRLNVVGAELRRLRFATLKNLRFLAFPVVTPLAGCGTGNLRRRRLMRRQNRPTPNKAINPTPNSSGGASRLVPARRGLSQRYVY